MIIFFVIPSLLVRQLAGRKIGQPSDADGGGETDGWRASLQLTTSRVRSPARGAFFARLSLSSPGLGWCLYLARYHSTSKLTQILAERRNVCW